jgi:peptide/nickel transport system permease protein
MPVVTIAGLQFGNLISGAVLVETVFSRPGLGSTILKAVLARDYQLVQAGVLVLAAAVVLLNTALDLIYGFIDPRLRQQ